MGAVRRAVGSALRLVDRLWPGGLPPGAAASVEDLDLDPAVLAEVDRVASAYVRDHPQDEYARCSVSLDRVRYARSVEWLRGALRPGLRVLELGGGGLSTALLRHAFPGVEIVPSGFDLRAFFPHQDGEFDAVLCMEVIEHVCDVEYAHATTLDGVRRCLSEARRVLRPRGKLFVTTPNAASALVLARALKHEPPWVYEWHFREFTFREIGDLVRQAGFAVLRAGTEQVWHFGKGVRGTFLLLRLAGASLEHRADDSFLLAEKP